MMRGRPVINMVRVAAWLFAAGAAFAAPVELAVKGLTIPQFDASGRLLRRITAEHAMGAVMGKSKLENGVVEFFDPRQGEAARVATLSFKDAVYDPKSEIITGENGVVLHSAKGDFTGKGFIYDLGQNRLLLKSAVQLDLPQGRLTGNTAEVRLASGTKMDLALITEARVEGAVTMTRTPDTKLALEKAATDKAVYRGSDETITLKSPVDVWNKGEQTRTTGSDYTLYVGKTRAPDTASAEAPPKTP